MNRSLVEKRRDSKAIFESGLLAVAPGVAIKTFCRLKGTNLTVGDQQYDLDLYTRIIVLGAGKAGASMAKAIEEILGDRLSEGSISVKYGHLEKLQKVKIYEAGHPVPDDNGFFAARKIFELASSADQDTLVICLISGGGSALLPLPVSGVSLQDKQEITKVLLTCGATIHEVNRVRKHLSAIKGGGLARAVYPATLITLILSDVVGDNLDSIASGPCVADSSTFSECNEILRKYVIEEQIPHSVRKYIEAGVAGNIPETPKADQIFFKKTQNVIIGSNYNALLKSKEKAEALGYTTLLLSSLFEGETHEVAAFHMAIAREIELHGYPISKPACLLSGGETTVTIKGTGKGGRNQEFVLAALLNIKEMQNVVIFSAGTDGTDGPTDAAGAIADNQTLQRAANKGLVPQKYLQENDSYSFFKSLNDLYITGPTNTNVMDLRIILI